MNGLTVRRAESSEYAHVRAFYHRLIDDYADSDCFYGWRKEVYPSDAQMRDALAKGELYVGEEDGGVASCMVLNHIQNEGYRKAHWSLDAPDEEILVLHLLGVARDRAGRGLARRMTAAAIELARERGMRALRLDVLDGNLPAERVYRAEGFRYVETLTLYYPDTGWTGFKCFELIL